jgi:hypothetical protein
MTHQPINLQSIDFDQPDGEFTFKGQFYQVKQYSNVYFFRNKDYKGFEFVYSFRESNQAEDICQQNYSTQTSKEIIEYIESIRRCIQYENTIFCFGITDYDSYFQGEGNYFSLKYRYWMPFNWKPFKHIKLDDILYKPHKAFFEKVITVYHNELPKIENEDLYDPFDTKAATIPLEFVCGSESQLKRLTQLAAVTLPELRPLFDQYSGFKVIYQSENDYYSGGVTEIDTRDWNNEVILSKQARQLFDLIFEYNFFTGLYWEYKDGRHDYTGYDPSPYTIEVEVQASSQHERLEAALELQSWLEGKLPEEEIQSYFTE